MNLETIKSFVKKLNSQGIPIPMLTDPLTGKSSVTLTMTVLSFNTALLGQLGKISKFLGEVDLTQANYLFLISLGAYLGRRIQGNGTTKSVDLDKKEG